jgi:hypothetical protein
LILPLDELVKLLMASANPDDTLPSEALWIKFASHPNSKTKYEATSKTIDYRTADGNTLVQVDLDQKGFILGAGIFP